MARSASSSFFAELRTIALATALTALVWVWAEGESVTKVSVPVRLVFPSESGSDLLLRPSNGASEWPGSAMLRFEGPTLAVDAAAALRGAVIQLAPGTPGLPSAAGPNQVVDLRRALAAYPEIERLRATLAGVEPEAVIVDVTRLVTREMPVRVELARDVRLVADPVASISKVRVWLEDEQSGQVPDDTAVVAMVTEDQILNLRGDGPETVKALCRLPAALGDVRAIRFAPESINVTLRVRQTLETFKLSAPVAVWFSLPPTENTRTWDVQVLDRFLPEVTVSGSAEAIGRVSRPAPGQPPIKALVEISSDDLARAERETVELDRPVVFTGLPAGVTPVGMAPSVRIRISRAAIVSFYGPPPPPAQPPSPSSVAPPSSSE